MSETVDIVLEHLRHIRRVVDDLRDDRSEIESRLDIFGNQYAGPSNRLDLLGMRVGRIVGRLELTEA